MNGGGNYVSQLNEYAAKSRLTPRYEDHGQYGPDHNKTFVQQVVLDGTSYPKGEGKTKKEAKQNAAENAWRSLFGDGQQPDHSQAEKATGASAPVQQPDINYICWLNEYGHKNGVTIKPEETTRPGLLNAAESCRFVGGGIEYPVAYGKTRRQAKAEAARLAYNMINGSESGETTDRNASFTSGEDVNQNISDICRSLSSMNSPDSRATGTNYIGIVDHYCQKTGRSRSYLEVERSGPAHILRFSFILSIDGKEYPVGEGKSKKEAKQKAAQLAWAALQEQSDWDSKVSSVSEDDTQSESAAPSATQNSNESSPQSESIVFADSSKHPSNQVSPKAAESQDNASSGGSTEEFSQRVPGSQNSAQDTNMEGASQTSTQSRFTSEFDSIKRLGEGGFGRVYSARHKLSDSIYAVKEVKAKNEKARREVLVLAKLAHGNIVRYYDCWMQDTRYKEGGATTSNSFSNNSPPQYLYITMELCRSKTLKHWIGDMNETSCPYKRREESLAIFLQIVDGVEYIHSNGLIHRDLKPDNILFGRDEKVKIGDFGLVTTQADGDEDMERTNTGTRSYMAPEQRSKCYDHKVDLFALGLIYFELLWKLYTFQEKVAIWPKARNQELPLEFSQAFLQEKCIIEPLLCQDPEKRTEASDLKAKLEHISQLLADQRNKTV